MQRSLCLLGAAILGLAAQLRAGEEGADRTSAGSKKQGAPVDAAVRLRLVNAIDVSYRLAAESRPAPAEVLHEFAPPLFASTNELRLPRKEDLRAYVEGRPWARHYQPVVGGLMERGAEDKETAWPRSENAEDLRKFLDDPDPDMRCMAVETLVTLRRPEDADPIRRLLRDDAVGPPTLAWNAIVTARRLSREDVEVDGLRADRSWQDYSVARFACLALGLITGQRPSDQLREWTQQLSHADRKMRREAADILHAFGDRTGGTFVALTRALAEEIRAVESGHAPADADFEALETRFAGLLVGFGTAADITTLALPLQEDNPRLRRTFAGILGRLGAHARPAVPSLIVLLGDKTMEVRMTAANALGGIGDRSAAPALVKALKDEAVPVRYCAAKALEDMGDRSVIPFLTRGLVDEEWTLRQYAVKGLGRTKVVAALPALVRTVERDVHPLVCKAAIAAIANIGGSSAATALEACVGTRQNLFRNEPIDALGELTAPEGNAALLRLLKNSDLAVRIHAAIALGRKGNAAAMDALAAAMANDESVPVRMEAVEAIGRIGERSAIPFLKQALDDKEWEVRCNAAGVLGEFGDSAGLPLMIVAAGGEGDEGYGLRCRAMQALGRIGGPKALEILRTGLKDSVHHVRCEAAAGLSRIGAPESADTLAAALGDESNYVRISAAGALAVIGQEECLPALRNAAKDPDFAAREAVLDAIRRVEAREILKKLVVRVGKTDTTLAGELSALTRTVPVAPVIKNLGKHGDQQVRGLMVNFIAKVGGLDDIILLERMRRDPEAAIRQASAAAITEIRDRQPRPPVYRLSSEPIAPVSHGSVGQMTDDRGQMRGGIR